MIVKIFDSFIKSMSAPSVHICESDGQFSYLVVHIEGLSTCYAYTIDKKTGGIYYSGSPDVDLFSNAKSAISRISDNVGHAKWRYLGKYLIGASIFDNQLVILVVVSDEITAIYDDDPIKMIKTTDHLIVPICGASANPSLPIFEFPLNENHYFSNHIDLSLPFPYTDESKRTTSFFWNMRWTEMFDRLGTPKACIRIFQGAALSLSTERGTENNITYIIRRSSLNSSTRYEARGLDKDCNTANECECDLIFTCKGENYGHTWIRGSAPVEWKTILSSTISTPQHIVSDNPTANTYKYFQKLMSRHDTNSISVVSLLNEAPEKGETDLLSAYRKGVQETVAKLGADIEFNQIDVNQVISKFKQRARIEIFGLLSALVGEVQFSNSREKQKKFMRFNCADSLDRTNLISFYYALIVATQFCTKNHIFLNYVYSREEEDLATILSSEALDFLCNAFIQTGNIISLIYTNTPAIKTEAIRKLMTESTSQSSDIAITLLRRYHNVASDPHRHQIFLEWIEVSDKMPTFYLDSIHLSSSFVPSMYPLQLVESTIFDEEERKFVFNKNVNSNIIVALPEPLLLAKVCFMMYPTKTECNSTITISCGNYVTEMHPFIVDAPLPCLDSPQVLEFNLRELSKTSSLVPVSILALAPAQFVNIRFNTMDESLAIGNIKIAVKLPKHKEVASIEASQSRVAAQKFNEYIKDVSVKSLSDLCEIDKWTLKECLSRNEFDQVLVKQQKNPFYYDIPSRFIEGTENECAFCHMKSDALKQFGSFRPYINYYRSFSSNEKPVSIVTLCPVCANCMEPNNEPYFDNEMLKSCTVVDQYAKRRSYRIDLYQPIFNIGSQSSIFFSSPKASSNELNELLNPTLSFKGWHTNSKHVELVISFQSSASVTQILLLLDKGITGEMEVFTDHFLQVKMKEISRCGNQVLYEVSNCEPTHFIHVVINGDKDLIIRNIQIRGDMKKFISDQASAQQSPVKERVKPFELLPYDGMFDFMTRTQTFRFQTPQEIKRITLKTSFVQSIYIVFILEHKTVDWQQLIIPKVELGTTLRFLFHDISGVFDEVKVFFLDKIPTVVPLQISFC